MDCVALCRRGLKVCAAEVLVGWSGGGGVENLAAEAMDQVCA
jgi:hypothetical protein